MAAASFCKLEVGRTVNGGGDDLIASGDRDVTLKKNQGEKSVWDHNFDILEVNYGVLLEMVPFFLPILLWELAKHHVLGTKFRVLNRRSAAAPPS